MSRKKAEFLAFLFFLVLSGSAVIWFAGGKRISLALVVLYIPVAMMTLYAAATAKEEDIVPLGDLLKASVDVEKEDRTMYLVGLFFTAPVALAGGVLFLLEPFDADLWVPYAVTGAAAVLALYCLWGLRRPLAERWDSGRAQRRRMERAARGRWTAPIAGTGAGFGNTAWVPAFATSEVMDPEDWEDDWEDDVSPAARAEEERIIREALMARRRAMEEGSDEGNDFLLLAERIAAQAWE